MDYSSVFKAYKVCHPQARNMTITRDVYLNKDEQWDSKDSQKNNLSEEQTTP